MLSNIEQITGYRYLCVSEHWTDHRIDHRTDHRTDCWIQWTNLTVTVVRSGFVIVFLCVLLRVYQLTVIIILLR